MQRFKDFTKKSGKVASAILSAAMVTSMVAGTNVVYAAEVNTQPVDVTAIGSQEEGEETAQRLVDALAKAFDGAYVTAATTNAEIGTEVGATGSNATKKDYKKLADDVMDDYKADYKAVLTYTPAAAIKDKEKADATLKIEVKNAAGTTTYASTVITKTIPSGNDRAKAVADDVRAYLQDKVTITDKTTTDDLKTKITKFITDEKVGDEIVKYADVDTASVDVKIERNGDTDKITVEGLKLKSPYDSTAVEVETNKTVATAASILKDVETSLPTYLENTKYFNSEMVDETQLEAAFTDFLADKDYAGLVEFTKDAFVLNKQAGKINDGLATASYTFKSTDTDDAGQPRAKATFKDLKITIPSDETLAEQALTELMEVAKEVEVKSDTKNSTDGTDGYEKDFLDKFKKANKDVIVGKADDIKLTGATFSEIEKFENVYGTGATASIAFIPAAATANKDAKPSVTFTVNVGDSKKIDTYTYDVASAATAVAKAQTAVEAAWNNMTFTNATTEADATAAAKEALKAYPTVKLAGDKVVFVKDEASKTITLNATLEDTRNGETKQANASKSYDYLSNEFVEKDGKKFYYDKDGKLLKNTFLQGTDSPDGYTYYIQNDGSVMQDRLTYHPNGKDVIYFDADGHEVFDAFVNVKKDVQGNAVDYIGYFGTLGGAYVNQTTYGNGVGAYSKDALFYINDYGVLENKGWFQNAAGEIGYAAPNGTLTTSQWSLDQFGRKVYFQANGFLAKGLMTDGVKYYQLDETDGHLVGEF